MIKILTLLFFLIASPAWAAVSRLGTGSTGFDADGSHSIPTGSDAERLIVCAIALRGAITPGSVTVTWGGQSMTLIDTAHVEGGSTDLEINVYYLDEAGIDAASGSAVVWTGETGGYLWVCETYDGVDQTTPIGNKAKDSTTSSTPNPLLVDITVDTDDAAGAWCANKTGFNVDSWHADFTERAQLGDGGGNTRGSYADLLATSGGTKNADCTHNTTDGHATIAFEINKVSAAVTRRIAPIFFQ